MQDTEGVEPLDWKFSWGKALETVKYDTPNTSAGTVIADQSGTAAVKNAEVQKFLTEKKMINLRTKPSQLWKNGKHFSLMVEMIMVRWLKTLVVMKRLSTKSLIV